MSITSLQRNDKDYLIGNLSVVDSPSDEELASWGVAEELRRQSPNSNIVWLRGHYVSAGANRNGQMFTAGEIAMKAVTARLQPITVMHRPREVVGVIADVRLNVPDDEAAAAGDVTTMDTVLAVWGHRFPEVAAEIAENSAVNTLMQSMEADAPWYECSECAERFVKPVDDSQHCEHLTNGSAHRTLGDVTFTGTGLIFGTRGSEGADPNAYLAEVAEWADARQDDSGDDPDDEKDGIMKVEIDKDEYDALKADATELKSLKRRVDTELEPKAAEAVELETKLTQTEAEKDTAVKEAEEAKTELASIKEELAAAELTSTRLADIPKALAEKLPESTSKRLAEKASKLTDEEWEAELAEKAELLGVKMDGEAAGDVFAEQAIAGFNPHGSAPTSGGTATMASPQIARSVAHMLRDKRKGK